MWNGRLIACYLKRIEGIVSNTNNLYIEALIVEDEIDICFLLTGILRKKNLQAAYVNNLREAKKALSSFQPAILFLDNNLPDGLGVDFISQVKHEHPYTKVVMITANDTISDKDKALKAGADFFIGKPFTRDMINKTIENLLPEHINN